jgi:hypothetical protein
MVTHKNLFQLINDEIGKRIKFSTSSSYKNQSDRVSISPVGDSGRYAASTGEIVTAIQNLLMETLPPYIEEGLEVTATSPISNKINISSGTGTAGGQLFELEEDISNLIIPFDNSTQVFYIVLTKTGINIDRTFKRSNLTLAKIVVPNPGTTSYIQDDKDEGWNAYIVNMKEYKLYGFRDKFEEDTIELLRNNISPILADNIIGNIRLNENLKIINTQGTLELDSNSLKLYDTSENLLSKFNQKGIFIYDADGKELAKFTGTEGRIGNIRLLPNSIQSANFVSGEFGSGFRIRDNGDAEFNDVTVRGTIYATVGEIGGWTIDSNKLYATSTGTIQTGASVGSGQNGVKLDYDGLHVYDDVLGRVVYFPSDGSAPQISSGTITEVIYEISTNSVLRTSETVGDGSGNSEGILINNTGLYGCESFQLLQDANLKALINGTVSLRGTIEAVIGQIGGVTITTSGLSGGSISGTSITSALFQTKSTLPRIRIDEDGLYYQTTTNIGKYGSSESGSYGFQYGDGTVYGTGVTAFLFNEDLPILSILSERNNADIRLYNRESDPSSGSHEIGDLICVNGTLKICTTGGSPGTFTDV